jgi:hypothetical protein
VHGFTTAMWISVGAVLLAALLAALLINVTPTHGTRRNNVGDPVDARREDHATPLSGEESPAGMHA